AVQLPSAGWLDDDERVLGRRGAGDVIVGQHVIRETRVELDEPGRVATLVERYEEAPVRGRERAQVAVAEALIGDADAQFAVRVARESLRDHFGVDARGGSVVADDEGRAGHRRVAASADQQVAGFAR